MANTRLINFVNQSKPAAQVKLCYYYYVTMLLALYTVLLPVPKAACKMLQLEGTLGQPADQPPAKKRK